MNNSTLKRFFVMIPDPEGSSNIYAAYTDNEFIMKQFMRSVESGIITNITGVFKYEIFEYMASSETHLFDLISTDFNIKMTVNNLLEVCESLYAKDICLYLTNSMFESLDCQYIYDVYNSSLYADLKYISHFISVLKLPSESVDMISLINDVYMPLIVILEIIGEVKSVEGSNMGRVLTNLLLSKGVPDEEIESFSLLNILDDVLVMYNVFRGDSEGGE